MNAEQPRGDKIVYGFLLEARAKSCNQQHCSFSEHTERYATVHIYHYGIRRMWDAKWDANLQRVVVALALPTP